MRVWGRGGYLAASAVGVALGGVAASGAGDPLSIGVGGGAAWALQAAAFWPLAGALARGERVLPVWIAGIGGRVGGLVLLALAAPGWGLDRREAVLTYALALLGLLFLEGLWLWKRQTLFDPATRRAGNGTDADSDDGR